MQSNDWLSDQDLTPAKRILVKEEIVKRAVNVDAVMSGAAAVEELGKDRPFHKIGTATQTPLAGKTICIAGKLDYTNAEMKKIIEQLGGQLDAKVSGKVTHLVCKQNEWTTNRKKPNSKCNQAKKLDIAVMSAEWIDEAKSKLAIIDESKYVIGGFPPYIAWLKGLSPKENREIPPLRYELAYRLKADFPHLTIVVNGGITRTEQMQTHLQQLDGVMIGREAYHNPWCMAGWDITFWPDEPPANGGAAISREQVEEAMVAYMMTEARHHGTPWSHIARHMLGLRNGTPGARKWRQVWSDHRLKGLPATDVWAQARAVWG